MKLGENLLIDHEPVIEIKDFFFKYPEIDYDIIYNANLQINKGDFVFIYGPSGAGKSTLCYCMTGLIPWSIHGYFKGSIKILGKMTTEIKPNDLAGSVAFLMQNPDSQFINLNVYDELIFGAENLLLKKSLIENRLDDIVNLLDLKFLLDRNVTQLSGGEKERVVLGSVLMMNPNILILDEPLAFLDAKGRIEIMKYLSKIHKSYDNELSIIVSEHRIEDVLPYAEKLISINKGQVISYNNNSEFNKNIVYKELNGTAITENEKLFYKSEKSENFSYESLLKYYNFKPNQFGFKSNDKLGSDSEYTSGLNSNNNESTILLSFKDISFNYIQNYGKYQQRKAEIFDKISFDLYPGDIVGILGSNGSGKTTLLYLLAGILFPTEGDIFYRGKNIQNIPYSQYAKNIGFIFQNPESQLLKNSIKKEIEFGPRNFGMLEKLNEAKLEELLHLIFSEQENIIKKNIQKKQISELNPFKLSWGQKRRLNLASLYAYEPEIYLLDEPFTGQDLQVRKTILKNTLNFLDKNKCLIITSHDEDVLNLCNKAILIEKSSMKFYSKDKNESTWEE